MNQKHQTIFVFIALSQIHFGQILKNTFLTLTKEFIVLNVHDIILGIIASPCPLLNYLRLIGKLYIWDCKRKLIHPYIEGFKQRIKINYQTEKYIAS